MSVVKRVYLSEENDGEVLAFVSSLSTPFSQYVRELILADMGKVPSPFEEVMRKVLREELSRVSFLPAASSIAPDDQPLTEEELALLETEY